MRRPESVERWMNRIDRGFTRAARKSPPVPEAVFYNSDGTENQRPAVQGWACLHNKPFAKDGRIVMFAGGCFIKSMCNSLQRKDVLLNHDPSLVVGSTDTGLEFCNHIDGLAFRLPLAGNRHAGKIKDLIDSADNASVSVGIEIIAHEVRKVGGYEVFAITEARIEEISLVGEPAVDGTCASLVDLDREEPDLWFAARSNTFAMDKSRSNLATRGRRLEKRAHALADAISRGLLKADAPAATAPEPKAAPRSMRWTLTDSNNADTARTEARQRAAARARGW